MNKVKVATGRYKVPGRYFHSRDTVNFVIKMNYSHSPDSEVLIRVGALYRELFWFVDRGGDDITIRIFD